MAKQLYEGRETYWPNVIFGPDISPLWQFVKMPGGQNSIIIYNDGSVVQQRTFENDQIKDPTVHTFILGGSDYRTTAGSFTYNALLAAGYTFRDVP